MVGGMLEDTGDLDKQPENEKMGFVAGGLVACMVFPFVF